MIKKFQWSISHGGLYVEAEGKRSVVKARYMNVTSDEEVRKILLQVKELVDNPFLGDHYAVTYVEGEVFRYSVGEKTEAEEVSLVIDIKENDEGASLSLLPTYLLHRVNELHSLFKETVSAADFLKKKIASCFSDVELSTFLINRLVELDLELPLEHAYRLGFTLRKGKVAVSSLIGKAKSLEELLDIIDTASKIVDLETMASLWEGNGGKSLLIHFEVKDKKLGIGLYAIIGENCLVGNEFVVDEPLAADSVEPLRKRVEEEATKLKRQAQNLSL